MGLTGEPVRRGPTPARPGIPAPRLGDRILGAGDLGPTGKKDCTLAGMADRRRFVQFPHPGGEHDAESGSAWNPNRRDSRHRRKFMLLDGQWVDGNDQLQAGELSAWGEWEPEAELVAELDRDGRPGLPRHLWRPYYIPKADYKGLHNTDPFIFGPRFLYSNCRQPRHASLRRLACGSVIAFGSGKTINGERRWVLDTVLVVKDFVDYEPTRARDELEGWASAEWLDVTAAPLADSMGGSCGGCTPAKGPRFRLYRGATPADPVDGMYSFFPALPAGADIGFSRPPVDLPGRYFNPRSWQAPKGLRHEGSIDELRSLWSSLVEQVREQGLVLGTCCGVPTCRTLD